MKVPADAVWIGSDHPFDLHEAYLNFRRDVAFDQLPKEATLNIAADSRYRLWINGAFVGRGPSRSWPHRQQVDAIEVAAFLKQGQNAIAIQVYSPGYSHFAYVHRGACGLLAWLDADGTTILATDADWRVRRDRSWREDVLRISIYGSGVERRDLRLALAWQQAPCNGPDWKVPRIVSPPTGPVWKALVPRDVPLLNEVQQPLKQPWRFKFGRATDIDDPHLALRAAWSSSRTSEACQVIRLKAEDCAIWAFDLNVSAVCLGTVKVSGAKGGERVMIGYAEKLRDGDLVISNPETYCRMRPTDEFILRAGDQLVESFSQRGGRYVIFAVEAPNDVELRFTFFIRQTSYPIEETKSSPSADPQLQRIAQMCRRTIVSCLQDGFVDSVWRESSQWLGDCVAEAFAFAAISDDVRPLRRAITMAAGGAYDDGALPSILPGEVHAYTVTDYNLSWVELLDLYWNHPAADDRAEMLRAMMPVLRKMLDRFANDVGEDGLIHAQAGRRLFLDWSSVDRREPSLTYNGRYLYALILASRLAEAVGEAALAGQWTAHTEMVRQSVIAAFSKDGKWRENAHGVAASQLGLALALLTDCVGDAKAAAHAIVARSLDLDDGNTPGKLVLASPFMHHYLFLALDHVGRRDDILSIIRARWGRWAEAGEPTTWENWNVDFPDGSTCHGFSAHPLAWIMRR